MTGEDRLVRTNAATCQIRDEESVTSRKHSKVRDRDHLTENYRGAEYTCWNKAVLNRHVPVSDHKVQVCDSHLTMNEAWRLLNDNISVCQIVLKI